MMEIKKPNPKSFYYLAVVLAVAILIFAGLWYFLSIKPVPESSVNEEIFKQPQIEKMIKKQTEALETLNKDAEPLTEKEIKGQTETLEEMNKGIKPLTEEEIQKQTEALDKLR